MKKALFLIIVMFFSINMFAQQSTNKNIQKEHRCTYKGYDESFVPDSKLLNQEVWSRVCEYRFECKVLRLAVEWENHEYNLLEMDGGKRLLARDKKFSNISKVITNLTLK